MSLWYKSSLQKKSREKNEMINRKVDEGKWIKNKRKEKRMCFVSFYHVKIKPTYQLCNYSPLVPSVAAEDKNINRSLLFYKLPNMYSKLK